MRYAVSTSHDYGSNPVVVRDYDSIPPGRVLCIIARENQHEAEQLAQMLCDLLNSQESK
jgi:hypothetical protein